jgi:hypothetical protein
MREADYIRQRIRVRLPAREATLADAAWIRVSSTKALPAVVAAAIRPGKRCGRYAFVRIRGERLSAVTCTYMSAP